MNTAVAFFVFNRPRTTSQVFAQIAKARPPKLFVVADGPRPAYPSDVEKCKHVRALVEQIDWPCEVSRNYAEINLGCGERVSSGLSWVFSQVDRAIILEDDCLPHSSFFPFCECMLDKYRDDPGVAMIAGSNFLLGLNSQESYTFSRFFFIWGWATWARAWRKYDFTLGKWEQYKRERQLHRFYKDPTVVKHLEKLFDLVVAGKLDTWDIQWFFCCLFSAGLCVVPGVNLISNLDPRGTHPSRFQSVVGLPMQNLDVTKMQHPERVEVNEGYDALVFWDKLRVSPMRKWVNRAYEILMKLLGDKD